MIMRRRRKLLSLIQQVERWVYSNHYDHMWRKSLFNKIHVYVTTYENMSTPIDLWSSYSFKRFQDEIATDRISFFKTG